MQISSSLLAVLVGLATVEAAAVSTNKSTSKKTTATSSAKATSACPPYTSTAPVTHYTTTVASTSYGVYSETGIIATPVSYTTVITGTTETAIVYTSTSISYFAYTLTSTKTPYGSKTVTQQTPCGFTPILSEPVYRNPFTTKTTVKFVATSTHEVISHATYSTNALTYTPRTTVSYANTLGRQTAIVQTQTAPAKPTKTVYAACGKDNVAYKDPGGGVDVFAAMRNVYKAYSGIGMGVTQTPEECCSLCFGNSLCFGSLWSYPTNSSSPGEYAPQCTIYVTSNSTACNAREPVFEVWPNPYYSYNGDVPPTALAASNGPCGRIVPAPDGDFSVG